MGPLRIRRMSSHRPCTGSSRVWDKTLTVLTESWRAPHPTTTAYTNMGIGILLLDGRLIARGQDGVYCYDLRKNAQK